jgi:hypothetical protein
VTLQDLWETPVAVTVHPPGTLGLVGTTGFEVTMEYAPTPRLMSPPPPIACFPAGHVAATVLVLALDDGLAALTYSTART